MEEVEEALTPKEEKILSTSLLPQALHLISSLWEETPTKTSNFSPHFLH